MARQLLLIANDEAATTFLWEGGRCRERIDFPRDAGGAAGFGELLDATGELPVRIAFDSVDEEFQSEVVPRVIGSARRELLQRRRQQAFLNAAYSVTVPQGRDPDSKRSERVLFAALTDSEVIDPWLAVIAERGLPLAGIYSVSLLSRHLYRWLRMSDRYSLLLFRQSAGKLRQSYFADGRFRVSRLTRIADGDPASLAERYRHEAEVTRQFLSSAKLMPRGEALHVHILHRPEYAAPLQAALKELPDVSLKLHDLSRLGRTRRLNAPSGEAPDGALLAAHLLARAQPSDGNYAAARQRTRHRLYRARQGLHWAAAASGLAAIGLAGWHLYQAQQLDNSIAATEQRHAAARQALAQAHRAQRHSTVAPGDMKAVVQAVQNFAERQRTPHVSLELLGQTLMQFEGIELTDIVWRAKAWEGGLVQGVPTAGQAGMHLRPQFAVGSEQASVQTDTEWLTVKGEFTNFDGDFRAAHARLELLVERLRALGAVVRVDVTTTPLNIDPRQALTARLGALFSGDQRPKAPFEFTVVLDHG